MPRRHLARPLTRLPQARSLQLAIQCQAQQLMCSHLPAHRFPMYSRLQARPARPQTMRLQARQPTSPRHLVPQPVTKPQCPARQSRPLRTLIRLRQPHAQSPAQQEIPALQESLMSTHLPAVAPGPLPLVDTKAILNLPHPRANLRLLPPRAKIATPNQRSKFRKAILLLLRRCPTRKHIPP